MKKLGSMVFALVGLVGFAQAGCVLVVEEHEGQLGYSWDVLANGAAADCASVESSSGAAYTSFVATLAGSGMGYDDLYNCSDAAATTSKLPLGDYTVVASLLDNSGSPDNGGDDTTLAQGGTATASLLYADELVVVTTFVFNVETAPATAEITFGVDYGVAGGANCTSTTAGGSGVAQTEIRLFETGSGMCLDSGQYGCLDAADQPSLCGLCAKEICQENSTALQLVLFAGSYEIDVIGYKGAVAGNEVYSCYAMAAPLSFTVVGGTNQDLGNLIAPFDDSLHPTECNATKPTR
ncbi:MAG: hypothetical protein EXR73_03375 [Myxococcales bacterium]|nr:hypothetical protein [Myxococcales bacterium]